MSTVRSFMYIKNKRGLNTDPCGTTEMICICSEVWPYNPLITNPTKCSDTLKQFIAKKPTNCLSVFDQFCGVGAQRVDYSLFALLEIVF